MDSSLKLIQQLMEKKIGNCVAKGEVLRSMANNVGYFDGNAIVEVSWLPFKKDAPNAWPVLQFLCTLAQNIQEDIVPVLKERLSELNGVTMLGYYGYYAPLQQIYHCYRLPVNPDMPEEMLRQVDYCLDQIRHQLDVFLDYVMIQADQPEQMTLEEYINGTNAQERVGESLEILEEYIGGRDD